MKILILLCLVAATYCNPQNCNVRMDEDQFRLLVDAHVNDRDQIECIHNVIKNNGDKIREVNMNIGDKTGNTKTAMKGDWIKKMMKAIDQDDIVERIEMNTYNVDLDDNTDDMVLDHFRSWRINLHHKDDCPMIKKLLDHTTVKNLERFTMYTNTEHEPADTMKFVTRNLEHIRHVKMNSHNGDYEWNRDRFFVKNKDVTQKMSDKNIQEIRQIGQHLRQQGKFRDVWLLCGNDVHDFDYLFKDNDELRKVDTNLDLTKLDDFVYNNVWLLDLHNVEVTKDHLTQWNKHFPNVRLMCVHDKNQNGLTVDQKNQIKQVFKHVDRTQECKKF